MGSQLHHSQNTFPRKILGGKGGNIAISKIRRTFGTPKRSFEPKKMKRVCVCESFSWHLNNICLVTASCGPCAPSWEQLEAIEQGHPHVMHDLCARVRARTNTRETCLDAHACEHMFEYTSALACVSMCMGCVAASCKAIFVWQETPHEKLQTDKGGWPWPSAHCLDIAPRFWTGWALRETVL